MARPVRSLNEHGVLDNQVQEALSHDFEVRSELISSDVLIDLAGKLYQIRKARNLRQEDVAATMGTTQSAVSDFEQADVNPTLDFIARYAAAVGARIQVEVQPAWEPLAKR